MNDVTTLMDGVLYRCPFSANASNLNAVKSPKHETIDLINSNDSNIALKQKIKYFNDSEIILKLYVILCYIMLTHIQS